MAKVRLSPKATYVERGYGQVEPNHLSAQRTGQIYAQLPAAADIDLLENGQFVKYDYQNGVVNFTGAGEWMLVFNEVKVYHEFESDADFAMLKDNYMARVYSPIDGATTNTLNGQLRYYGGTNDQNQSIPSVATPADPYEFDSTNNPFASTWDYASPKDMPTGTKMVPRVLKTNIGDIFTTNTFASAADGPNATVVGPSLAVGNYLSISNAGWLTKANSKPESGIVFQVVAETTMPDAKAPGVKIQRVQ